MLNGGVVVLSGVKIVAVRTTVDPRGVSGRDVMVGVCVCLFIMFVGGRRTYG